MARLIVLIVIVVVVAWWLLGRSKRRTRDERDVTAAPAQDMVQCAHCGVHLPRGDAVFDGALAYCGEAHRLAGPREK
jgi:uncharacterized protein